MKKKIETDEIDLIEVIINICNNKLKIAAITVILMVLSAALYFIIKPPFKAQTEILPITIFENNLYSAYNSLLAPQSESDDEKILTEQRLNKINRNYLLNLFLEELQTKEIVIEAIKKYQLINESKFDDEDEYLEAVEKYALTLDLLRPINVDGSQRGETRLNWTIEFEINDQENWENALSYIDNEINQNIQNYLAENFSVTLDNLKLLDQFKLEDLNQKIEFAKNDYDIETSNRLAFLNEQSSIARELNIKNNTLEVENFNTSSGGVISNLQTAKPYYMRGYSMIEKEIELIESRNNKDAFTKNLLDLEKQKRNLLEDKSLDRIKQLFNSTPIVNDNKFKAAGIIYKDTKYEASFSLIKAVLFAGIFGIIFGMFYVLISNAIQQRR
jgi:LPS O-antigen subunit length determinant protein (WzzB/FepE family)